MFCGRAALAQRVPDDKSEVVETRHVASLQKSEVLNLIATSLHKHIAISSCSLFPVPCSLFPVFLQSYEFFHPVSACSKT